MRADGVGCYFMCHAALLAPSVDALGATLRATTSAFGGSLNAARVPFPTFEPYPVVNFEFAPGLNVVARTAGPSRDPSLLLLLLPSSSFRRPSPSPCASPPLPPPRPRQAGRLPCLPHE